MVRHVILWTIKPEYKKSSHFETVKEGIREGLEALNGKIPGMVSLRVITDSLPSSSADVMLDCLFESGEALKAYAKDPLHNAAADGKVRPYTDVRLCMDFEE